MGVQKQAEGYAALSDGGCSRSTSAWSGSSGLLTHSSSVYSQLPMRADSMSSVGSSVVTLAGVGCFGTPTKRDDTRPIIVSKKVMRPPRYEVHKDDILDQLVGDFFVKH